MHNDSLVTDNQEIRKLIFDHFSSHFNSSFNDLHITMSGCIFKSLSSASRKFLEYNVTKEEVWSTVLDCGSSKASGPNGFNMGFIKNKWDLLKDDILNFVYDFWETSTMARCVKASFIALILKVQSLTVISDFRPICLVGSLYKIVSKLLANRLKLVMPEIIGDSQSAFIGGRQILDSVLIANETVDWARKKKQKLYVLQLDFAKAYDCVQWSFLDYLMVRIGFGVKWKSWIKGCIQVVPLSILINGSPTCQFNINRGLRQGCPLSPFLFNIVA